MSQTLSATFATRREAELVVEHLVQEHGVERSDIFVAPEGQANSSGEEVSGADRAGAEPGVEARNDAALNGRIGVSVDLQDDDSVAAVRATFEELGGTAA